MRQTIDEMIRESAEGGYKGRKRKCNKRIGNKQSCNEVKRVRRQVEWEREGVDEGYKELIIRLISNCG